MGLICFMEIDSAPCLSNLSLVTKCCLQNGNFPASQTADPYIFI